MNLLVFNLATDGDDPLLRFSSQWINRLAAHYERIDVVTMRAGRLITAENVHVHSVGKEKGYGEFRRALEFYRILSGLRRERPYSACFAHMMPLFAVMGAPLLLGVPMTLWYAHRQAHLILRLATALSERVVSATAESFPLKTEKLRIIGHGIDTDFFTPVQTHNQPIPTLSKPVSTGKTTDFQPDSDTIQAKIVHVARLMPIKHQATLIHALVNVEDAEAVFVGDVPPGIDAGYRAELETLARDLGVAERVTFAGGQSAEGVRDWDRQAAIAVNLSPLGLFDKAALESMAVGVPTVVGSTAFDDVVQDERLKVSDPDDARALAKRLNDLLALPESERRAIGAALRERVLEAHSLDHLIGLLIHVLNTGEPA